MDTKQGQNVRKRKRPNNSSVGEPCVPLEFKWPVSMCFVDCIWLSSFKSHTGLLLHTQEDHSGSQSLNQLDINKYLVTDKEVIILCIIKMYSEPSYTTIALICALHKVVNSLSAQGLVATIQDRNREFWVPPNNSLGCQLMCSPELAQ